MEIKDILKNRRIELGMTQLDVAKSVGVSEATVSRWESGDIANMRRSRIAALAKALQISPSVIMGWDASEVPFHTNILPMPKMRKWKVLGAVACGEAIHRESEDEQIDAPADIDADYVYRCVGDSMTGAHIFDGDLVFIKWGEEVPDGAIGLVRVEDAYMLKRIFHRNDCLELRSDNPAYPPKYITGDQVSAEIVGRAVKFLTDAI